MIHPSAIIYPGVHIEDDVHIGAYCVIGGPPEDKKYFNQKENFGVIISKGTRISDLVTVHAGTIRTTYIGPNACIFAHSHVGHDVIIGNSAIIGGGVSLAGHTHVMPGANVSGRSGTVPFVVIGAYSFVGAFSLITKHIPPGEKWIGFPARNYGRNEIGLERAGITHEECLESWGKLFLQFTEGKNL